MHTKTDATFSSQIEQVMTEYQKSVEFNILKSAWKGFFWKHWTN